MEKTADKDDRHRLKSVGPKMSATSYCLAKLPLDPVTAAKVARANVFVGEKRERDNTVVDIAVLSRWDPTGDGKEMPDIPDFLRREMPMRMAA
jgi:hypothetical protein